MGTHPNRVLPGLMVLAALLAPVAAAAPSAYAASPPSLSPAVGAAVAARLTSAAPSARPLADTARSSSLNSDGQCATFPASVIPGDPWSLQRVLLPELWHYATGRGVTVAVIDTGVDTANPQLRGAVVAGKDYLAGGGGSTTDPVGHGTMVAGIIAARPSSGTGVVGIAPGAKILALRQNDARDSGTDASLAAAIGDAVAGGARVINISQDVSTQGKPVPEAADGALGRAVAAALGHGVVVVAAAGNEGLSLPTYPASFPGVLGVGASDRDNERAADFSEMGSSVSVAAPGVNIVSTAPKGGHCVENGTSFAAPYVAGVAALLVQLHPTWSPAQIGARIEQTAQRTQPGRNDFIGWGVVDPVAAVSDPAPPESAAKADTAVLRAVPPPVVPRTLDPDGGQAARDERTATYALGLGALLVVLIAGTAVVLRDHRRRLSGAG